MVSRPSCVRFKTMARNVKSQTALSTATVTPIRGKGDNSITLNEQAEALIADVRDAIKDYHSGTRMQGTAMQRIAYDVLKVHQIWADMGNNPVTWADYRAGGKARTAFNRSLELHFLGAAKKYSDEAKYKPVESTEIKRRANDRQLINRAAEFASWLVARGVKMEQFKDGFWVVSPTMLVKPGYTPNLKIDIPLDNRAFSANKPAGEGRTSDSWLRIQASVAAFVSANRPTVARAARTPQAILDAIKECGELGPLCDRILALLDPKDEEAEEGWVPNIKDFPDWNKFSKVLLRGAELNNDAAFTTPRKDDEAEAKSA